MKYLIFILFSANCFSQTMINEQSLEIMLPKNPTVESINERVNAAEVLKGSLGRSFLPKVLLSYGHERYTTGPYLNVNQPYGGVEAKINVFNSGRDQIVNEQREKQASIAKIDSIVTRVQLKAEILKNMAQYAYLEELQNVLVEAKGINDKNLKSAQNRINAGLGTKTDSLDFRQQNIMLEQQITALSYELNIVKRIVATLLGLEPESSLQVSFVNSHPEHIADKSMDLLSNNSLLLTRANLLTEIAKLDSSQAKKWWTPSLDIYGYALRFTQKEREYPTPGQRNDTGIGFRLTFPIFDGGEGIRQSQAQTALAKAQESAARMRKLEVERDILNAKSKLQLAHDLIHGAEENAEIMDEYRTGILNEYVRGIKNSPDVLQASQRWIQSKMNFAEVKKNYQFAKADALFLVGVSN